jgi:hypothetical protein
VIPIISDGENILKQDIKKTDEVKLAQINLENQIKYSNHVQRFPPRRIVNPQTEVEKEL